MSSFLRTYAKAALLLIVFTLLCGVVYTGAVTGAGQLLFRERVNGGIIEVDGVKYGSEHLGQQYSDEKHMWGRIMNVDVSTYKDAAGKALLYASTSNLSPASAQYAGLIAERAARLRAANGSAKAVPAELVTCSGSGLDPDISPEAALYQVSRIAKGSGRSEAQVREIIAKCTTGKFLGIFGEERVNVLRVNLMLDGILK